MSKSPSTLPADEPPAAAPAATVIVLRDDPPGLQIFMVRRHTSTAFMPGADVFPGGRVDAGDCGTADGGWCDGIAQAAAQLQDLEPDEAVAYHVAAMRETFEEAGILLARDGRGQFIRVDDAGIEVRFAHHRRAVHSGARSLREVIDAEGLRLALDALVPFAHWLTPPFDVRRFDTRFFLARLPPGQRPAHDDTETTHGVWVTPAEALARCRRGETSLPPPTWTTLRELERFGTADDAVAWARGRRIQRRQPQLVETGGLKWLVLPGDPLCAEVPTEPPPPETRFQLLDGRWLARTTAWEAS